MSEGPRTAWEQFCDLDGMFPTRRWARAYLLGLGGCWGLFAVIVVAAPMVDSPLAVAGVLVMLACGVVPIATWIRWMWLHRRSVRGFLVAYAAGLNFPSQITGAFRRSGWDARKAVPILLLPLLVAVLAIAASAVRMDCHQVDDVEGVEICGV